MLGEKGRHLRAGLVDVARRDERHDLDVASLTQLIRDYKSGRLEQICRPRAVGIQPEQKR